jgi:hypothetical protein
VVHQRRDSLILEQHVICLENALHKEGLHLHEVVFPLLKFVLRAILTTRLVSLRSLLLGEDIAGNSSNVLYSTALGAGNRRVSAFLHFIRKREGGPSEGRVELDGL